jgi:hypothetical protein
MTDNGAFLPLTRMDESFSLLLSPVHRGEIG